MDFRTSVSTDAGRASAAAGPIVVFGDPVPTRLIAIRDALGVAVGWEFAADWMGSDSATQDRSIDSQWLKAWRDAWVANEELQVALREGTSMPELADLEPAEWFEPDSQLVRPGVVESAGIGKGLSGRPYEVLSASERAVNRGLIALYVLPIPGIWTGHRERILLVSTGTYDSNESLRDAFDAFGSEIGTRVP